MKKETKPLVRNVTLKMLTVSDIQDFCILKEQYWKYGLKKQLGWWIILSSPNDRIIFLEFNGKKISFCRLKKRKILLDNVIKDSYYLTELCVHKNFLKQGFAKLIIKESNKFLENAGHFGHLLCTFELKQFYLNLGWHESNNFFSRKNKDDTNECLSNKFCFSFNIKKFEEIVLIGSII